MPITVLTDRQVKFLLNNLTTDEVLNLQNSMRCALYDYATGASSSQVSTDDQPHKTKVSARNGTTTLFMPSVISGSMAVKVATFTTPSAYTGSSAINKSNSKHEVSPQGALTLMTAEGIPFAFINSREIIAFRTALTSSLLISRRSKVKVLTCFGCGRQAYWHVRLTLLLRGSSIKKVNFINRTLSDRAAALLKEFIGFDPEIKKAEGWSDTSFNLTSLNLGDVERALKTQVRSADVIFCTTPSTVPLFDPTILTSNEGRKRARLIVAVGSYSSDMIELPPEIIDQAIRPQTTNHFFQRRAEEGGAIVVDSLTCLRDAGELVEANVRADRTVELGELVMLEYIENEQAMVDDYDDGAPQSQISQDNLLVNNSNFNRGVFRSDSIDSCSSGTPLSKITSRKSSTNLSKPPSSKRSGNRSRRSSDSSNAWKRRSSVTESINVRLRKPSLLSLRSRKTQTELENKLSRWLSIGNVIYKSVGIGLMDLVSGIDIVKLAKEKGIGTTISDF
ncbi:hypothetical protein HI914_06786 [Erysiphe necator]|uniref:Putative family decarboxylase n=1 Tax=Uncinula necator TaxID=52586 RepID=A0A0B1PBC0_UNCNE|nr:hypothetical protein HI914_06786 [Erysiphe necator]KHJ33949.1 putative family decarboxylase [Erysiphe necator]